MTHAQRYQALAARLNDTQKKDSYYTAACFLLAYDDELAVAVKRFVSSNGIDFIQMKRALRGFDDTSRTIVEIAHSLFHCGPASKATPHDIAALPYPWLELVVDAMYISQGKAEVMLQNDGISVCYDKYKKSKAAALAAQEILASMAADMQG